MIFRVNRLQRLSGNKQHLAYMRLAFEQAQCAAAEDEVPVGAVIELQGKIIGSGHNQNRQLNDPSAHAEINALRAAAQHVDNLRLNGANLYVTLEPCVMCAGAILHARIDRVFYATADVRWGAAGSIANVLESPLLNHQCQVVAGYLQQESAALLEKFFAEKRKTKHSAR